jgi:type IV pilus assembly protein PilM
MAKKRSVVLGIEFHTDEVRVVEMRKSGIAPVVGGVSAVPLPAAAMEGGVVMRADVVADAVSKAIETTGSSTRAAVLGLPTQAVTMRVIDIPPVPDSELSIVVEGELKHFDVLREDGGTFDFLKLRAPIESPTRESQVLLMAVEESILSGYRDVATRAGLQVEGIEPIHLAMYRSAHELVRRQPSTMVVTISNTATEISFVVHDSLALYRRVDLGVKQLVGDSEANAYNEENANAMAMELRRSLDYFHRQYNTAPPVSTIVTVVTEPRLQGFGNWLAEQLRLTCLNATLESASAASPELASRLDGSAGLAYIGAVGLALRGLGIAADTVPSFDLSRLSGATYERRMQRRTVFASLVASAAILALFGAVAGYFAIRGRGLEDEVAAKRVALNQLNAAYRPASEAKMARLSLLRQLSREGVPFQFVMDAVAASLDPGAGLTQINLGVDSRIRLSGEATSELAVINTLEKLRRSPYFTNSLIESFDKRASGGREGIRFEISCNYLADAIVASIPTANAPPVTTNPMQERLAP